MKNVRPVVGYAVGIVGVLGVVVCASVTLWWIFARPNADHDGLYFPTILFAAVGWWGFFWAEPKRAVQGGDWLIAVQQRVAGRRKTDSVVAVPEAAPTAEVIGVAPAPAQPAAPAAPAAPRTDAVPALKAAVTIIDPSKPVGAQIEGEGD